MSAKVFHWDYTQQPPMEEIIEAVQEAAGFTVVMSMPDTGSDEYALVVQPARDVATDEQNAGLYEDWVASQ